MVGVCFDLCFKILFSSKLFILFAASNKPEGVQLDEKGRRKRRRDEEDDNDNDDTRKHCLVRSLSKMKKRKKKKEVGVDSNEERKENFL